MVYHTNHILGAYNIGGNRAFQRKLLRNEVSIDLFLVKLTKLNTIVQLQKFSIIVYDNCLDALSSLRPECFLYKILIQLIEKFSTVFLLKDGFLGFQAKYPDLCWINSQRILGEDIVEYNQTDCDLEKIIDLCLETTEMDSIQQQSSETKHFIRPNSQLTCSSLTDNGNNLKRVKLGSIKSKFLIYPSTNHDTRLHLSSNPKTLNTSHVLTSSAVHNDDSNDNQFLKSCQSGLGANESKLSETNSNLPNPQSMQIPKSMNSCFGSNSFARPSPILPHLVLGSQEDANSSTICEQYGITHIINVSPKGTLPLHIDPEKFYQIPVNDDYTDQIYPYFEQAFQFIDMVRTSRGRVLIHCSAGISRSPTLAIAYLMHSCGMTMRDAYAVVKLGRSSVAPNFNFLGQLLEFEQTLKQNNRNNNTDGSSFSQFTAPYSSDSCPNQSKHLSKKRDRPTYLNFTNFCPTQSNHDDDDDDDDDENDWMIRIKSDASCSKIVPNLSGLTPTEGKRSRISTVTMTTMDVSKPNIDHANTLLPSPCTGLSKLEISSPRDEHPCRPPFCVGQDLSSHLLAPIPKFVEQKSRIQSFLNTSSTTSLNNLKFEPCSVMNDMDKSHNVGLPSSTSSSTSSSSFNLKLRRSVSNIGTIRLPYLFNRFVESNQSAPSTTPDPVFGCEMTYGEANRIPIIANDSLSNPNQLLINKNDSDNRSASLDIPSLSPAPLGDGGLTSGEAYPETTHLPFLILSDQITGEYPDLDCAPVNVQLSARTAITPNREIKPSSSSLSSSSNNNSFGISRSAPSRSRSSIENLIHSDSQNKFVNLIRNSFSLGNDLVSCASAMVVRSNNPNGGNNDLLQSWRLSDHQFWSNFMRTDLTCPDDEMTRSNTEMRQQHDENDDRGFGRKRNSSLGSVNDHHPNINAANCLSSSSPSHNSTHSNSFHELYQVF